MFKSTIYTVLALSAAFTTLAAPTVVPGVLVKKDAAPQDIWTETGGVGQGTEVLKRDIWTETGGVGQGTEVLKRDIWTETGAVGQGTEVLKN